MNLFRSVGLRRFWVTSRSENLKRLWADPDFRKKHKEAMNKPETKKLISRNSKRQMADPEIKNKMITTMKKKFADPKMRKKISERTKEAMKSIDLSGPNNSQWKGGVSIEPYCRTWTDKEFKSYIFERDNHTCQNTDCWGKSKILTRHHIDYDKKNCVPDNIITLCNSCNVRANTKREYWKKLYEEIRNEIQS